VSSKHLSFVENGRSRPSHQLLVVATLGAPLDVGPSDLALETFLPADPASADRLRALARMPAGASSNAP
jgi:hypothetical protein